MIAVGVDVGKGFLDVAVHGELKVQQFNNTAAGIRQLVRPKPWISMALIVCAVSNAVGCNRRRLAWLS